MPRSTRPLLFAVALSLALLGAACAPKEKKWNDALVAGRRAMEAKKFEKAEELFEKSRGIAEKLNPSGGRMGESLAALGEVHARQGKDAPAEAELKKAVEILGADGKEDASLGPPLTYLAILQVKRGEYDEADQKLMRALKAMQNGGRLDTDPDLLNCLSNLAALLMQREKKAHAEPVLKRVIAAVEKTEGTSGPSLVEPLNSMGLIQKERGLLDEAERNYRRALLIANQQERPNYRLVAILMTNLASVLQLTGQSEAALAMLREGFYISEQVFGADNINLFPTLRALGDAYVRVGKYSQAEPVYQRALALAEKQLGPESPAVVVSLGDQAVCYTALGRHADAEAVMRRALGLMEKNIGADRLELCVSLTTLAASLKAQSKYDEARTLLERASAIYAKAQGEKSPYLPGITGGLAELALAQGRLDEADERARHALELADRTMRPEDPNKAVLELVMADVNRARDRLKEAEAGYNQALPTLKKALGDEHPRTLACMTGLAEIWRKTGREAQAAEAEARIAEIGKRVKEKATALAATKTTATTPTLQTAGPLQVGPTKQE